MDANVLVRLIPFCMSWRKEVIAYVTRLVPRHLGLNPYFHTHTSVVCINSLGPRDMGPCYMALAHAPAQCHTVTTVASPLCAHLLGMNALLGECIERTEHIMLQAG